MKNFENCNKVPEHQHRFFPRRVFKIAFLGLGIIAKTTKMVCAHCGRIIWGVPLSRKNF